MRPHRIDNDFHIASGNGGSPTRTDRPRHPPRRRLAYGPRFTLALLALLPFLASPPAAAEDGRRGVMQVRSLLGLRHDKVVRQRWELSCGAAALATILAYQDG